MMEEKIDVERVFRLLDSGDDILLLNNGETFTVARFKSLLSFDFKDKFGKSVTIYEPNIPIEHRQGTSISGFLETLKAGQTTILRSELIWKSKIIDCQFLKIGSKGWEKGKIIIQCIPKYKSVSRGNTTSSELEVQVDIEFSPDEPPQPESPLDDLRELPEYKQQM
jgi:hypothetical protein